MDSSSSDLPITSFAAQISGESQSNPRRRPSSSLNDSSSSTKRRREMDYSTDMQEILEKQHENNEMQTKYLELCVERAEIAKNRENLQLKRAEIELKLAEECMRIEVDKKRKLAAMELEAKRRELNL